MTSLIAKNIHAIAIGSKSGTIPANNQYVSVTADVPSGWNFLCWNMITTSGWVGSGYAQNPESQTSNMWVTNSSSSARGISASYLMYK